MLETKPLNEYTEPKIDNGDTNYNRLYTKLLSLGCTQIDKFDLDEIITIAREDFPLPENNINY